MAFRISDFKKTTRKVDNRRILYPYQIRDDRYTAAIGYAIAYYERMVGQRQSAFESETLLEFFGDARLARGLVACLGRTYIWHTRSFAEAFGDTTASILRKAGMDTPAQLRARLYGLANGRYGGFILPHERAEALELLCANLPFNADQFEHGLILDRDDQRILVKVGPTPTPQEIIARYNYHALETALQHAESLRLCLGGSIWHMIRSVHNLARRYNLSYQIDGSPRTLFDSQVDLVLSGQRDALGRWTTSGRRLARVLLRLLATHPDSLRSGEATVHLGSQSYVLRLDARALRVLGVAAAETPPDSLAWHADPGEAFRRAWGRMFLRGKTDGWRLGRDPEPVVGSGVLVVPDFVLRRGHERVAVCLPTSRSATAALLRDLASLETPSPICVVASGSSGAASSMWVTYATRPDEAIPDLVATLVQRHPRDQMATSLTPWQRLEQLVAQEGFVNEQSVATILGCRLDEVATVVQRWGGPALHMLPGMGVCAAEFVEDIRDLVEQEALARYAA